MSEVQPARTGGSRGRGGFRGGRGGFRGGRTSRTQKEDQENVPLSLEDQGELGELKRKFGDKITLLRDVCPGWSDEDLVFALEETNGDLEAAADRISSGESNFLYFPNMLANSFQGTISQWGEVKKKQPKAKDAAAAEGSSSRGRGRGGLDSRGRGRGTERGGRGGRGARVASQANGTKHTSKEDGWGTTPTATETAGAWDTSAATEAPGAWDTSAAVEPAGAWDKPTNGDAPVQVEPTAQVEDSKPATISTSAKKPGGWAGLFAKPPPAPKSVPVPAAQPESLSAPTISAPIEEPVHNLPPPIEPQVVEDSPSELPSAPHSESPNDLPPSTDALTEDNLEQLPDVSHPPASQTVASTTASTQDPLAQIAAAKSQIRPTSGYHATALKATGAGGRSASFVRKVKEQQEAVVMPGHHDVGKAAVQFGKMGLNGDSDDYDEEREDPETRTPLPDDSPAAPRASLPPGLPDVQQQATPAEIQAPTEPQAQRQAPGLPPAPQQAQHSAQQAASGFGDPYRYGQSGKTYDPFGQPPTTQAPSAQQEPFASQVPGQSQNAGHNDMSSYYGREAYAQYYGAYGQQQDAHRGGSFGTSGQDIPSQYATAGPQRGYSQHESQNSGNNTPAPTGPTQQGQASQAAQQQQQMGASHGGYPYGYPSNYAQQQYPQYSQSYMNQMSHRYGANRPMFDDARRGQQQQQQQQQQEEYYGNQYGYGKNQHYGGGSYNSSMYGQPQQQYSYDQGTTGNNAGAYAGRGDNGYGRSGSAQPSDQQTSNTAGFGSMPDPFGRSSSGFGQSQSLGQHGGSHQSSEEVMKASGPSPALQSGRPGSTTNAAQGQQGGLGQQQSHNSQQGFGGYPQYGGGFGFSGQQGGHQSSQYGAYGSNAFGGSYGGYGGGRGWNNH